MHDLVVSLTGLGGGALAVAGGKAANLGELLRAGLPVPPGFCVTTAAYRAVARDPSVRAAIERLAAVDRSDAAGLAAGATAVREALLRAPVPEGIAAACARAYAGLGHDVVVAVRSSATAEDLPDASFAGQQDTLLGVRGDSGVLAALRRCWASLFSERAVAYRAPRGIAPDAVELADGKQRPLGIPTIRDRVVQMAKFNRVDDYVWRRLKRFMVKRKGRNLRAGECSRWTDDFFHGHGLYRLRGTIKHPEAA